HQVRVQVQQGPQDEIALRQAGVRDLQGLRVHDAVVVERDVQVYGAGSPARRGAPAQVALHLFQVGEQVLRLQARLHPDRGVEVGRRRRGRLGRRLVQR